MVYKPKMLTGSFADLTNKNTISTTNTTKIAERQPFITELKTLTNT